MDRPDSATSGELLAAMRRFHAAGDTSEPLALAREAWDHRPPGEPIDGDDLAELGEVWRLASLAATRPDAASTERLVWRSRAQSAFLRSGNRNGTAMLMLPALFESIREGAPGSELLAIVESMRLIADDAGPVPKAEVLSTCYEKEGYFRTLDAEALPLAELDERAAGFSVALRCYDLALEAETSGRRRSKIRAATASTSFLAATDDDGRQDAIQTVLGLISEIEGNDIPAGDVVQIARNNIDRMTQGRRDLLTYEIT